MGSTSTEAFIEKFKMIDFGIEYLTSCILLNQTPYCPTVIGYGA